MYFPDELWFIIKNHLFHNIKKHGKHLKNKPEIKQFNNIVKSIPIKIIPRLGPRIVYSSVKNEPGRRFIKYIYHVHTHLNHNARITRVMNDGSFFYPRSYMLIEYQLLPLDYDKRDRIDEILRNCYWIDACYWDNCKSNTYNL